MPIFKVFVAVVLFVLKVKLQVFVINSLKAWFLQQSTDAEISCSDTNDLCERTGTTHDILLENYADLD